MPSEPALRVSSGRANGSPRQFPCRYNSAFTGGQTMRKLMYAAAVMTVSFVGSASAQVELKSYADGSGYIDVQSLTCAQLAGTFQEDADLLTTWYSGWYNGLG